VSSSKLQPAFYGGLLLGVLSALPIISLGNVCCCLWVLTGGAIAAYVLQANQPMPITAGDGATVGLLAGLIGSVVQLVVSIPVGLMMGPIQGRLFERLVQNAGDVPDNLRPLMEAMRHGGFSVVGAILGFLLFLFVALVFSTIGGLLGAALFRKKGPAFVPPPPDLPPPPPLP
jgi:prolipoprotein diacylglyceryltransferase